MHRIKHWVRWEFLLLLLTVVIVFNFAYEPNQRALIESLFEAHYADLQRFYQVYQAVETKPRLTTRDIQYAHFVLSNLLDTGFVLKPEVYHTLGKLFEREQQYQKALSSYEAMLKVTGQEYFLRRDALLGMARVYITQRKYKQACAVLEEAWSLPTKYRQLEVGFSLLDVYDRQNAFQKQKEIVLSLSDITSEYANVYTAWVKRVWKTMTANEQSQLLQQAFRPSLTNLLLEQGKQYVLQSKPPVDWVENWAFFLVSLGDDALLKKVEVFLRGIKEYDSVAGELQGYGNLSVDTMLRGSSKAKAGYAYRALLSVSRRGRYQPDKAEKYYEGFLKNGFEPDYVSKNIELLIRNMLAYKRYEKIVYWVERTYGQMGMADTSVNISPMVSFWYGYSAFQLGQPQVALREWARTIAISPHGYYGGLAASFLKEVFPNEQREEYLDSLLEQKKKTKSLSQQLFYATVLYGLSEDKSRRESYRQEVVEILSRLYPDLFGASLQALNTLPMEKYFRWLVYSRFGFEDYAREIVYESGVHDDTAAKLAILKVLVYYQNFDRARALFSEIEQNEVVRAYGGFLPREFQKILYPLPYTEEVRLAMQMQTNVFCDLYLVHAVIKGESLFYPRAVSRVGARGLMQVMPATARLIAPSVFDDNAVSLYDPANNILLGTRFLSSSIAQYGLLGAISVYNGGQRPLSLVREKFRPESDVEMIEIHPYTETRNYVKKVIGYYQSYLLFYEGRNLSFKELGIPRLLTLSNNLTNKGDVAILY